MNDGLYAAPPLRLAIAQAGWNVRALADELGYSKTHLYNVLSGRAPVRRVVAQRIATLVQGDIAVLFVMSSRNGGSHGDNG